MRHIHIYKSTHKPLLWLLMGWILCFSVFTSCGKSTSVVYSEFIPIDEDGIPENWEFTFSPAPFDSTEINDGRFDVIVLVRYSNRCASKSVILDMESISLEHTAPDSARLTIPLLSKGGHPVGNGNLGIYETADTVARAIRIPEGFVVSLSSPLPSEQTAGIIDIGIKLSRSGQADFNIYDYIPVKDLF